VILDHLLKNIPDLLSPPLKHLLGRLDRVGMAEFLEPTNDEGLE
jgi:hypothetical protein